MKVIDYPCPKCLADPGVQCAYITHWARVAVWHLCTRHGATLSERKTWWSQVEDAIKAGEGDHQ